MTNLEQKKFEEKAEQIRLASDSNVKFNLSSTGVCDSEEGYNSHMDEYDRMVGIV